MTEVLDRPTQTSTQPTVEKGKPQRESVAIALKELGFYDRIPQIRRDSRDYLLSNRKRLLAERPAPKMTKELALARREDFRSRRPKGSELLDASKFTLTTFDPQSEPYSGTIQLPAQDLIQFGEADVVGHGSGFNLDPTLIFSFLAPFGFISAVDGITANSEFRQFVATWDFPFTPPADGSYILSSGLVAWGNWTLISDDGPFDSHEVHATLTAGIQVNGGASNFIKQFDRGDDNINEADSLAVAETVPLIAQGTAGVQMNIVTGFLGTVAARGDDTFAQMNLSQAVGGMLCGGLTIQQIA